MTVLEKINQSFKEIKSALKLHLEILEILEFENSNSNIYYEIGTICESIKERLNTNDVKDNYLMTLYQNVNALLRLLPFAEDTNLEQFRDNQNRTPIKWRFENAFKELKLQLDQLKFNFNFFNKLKYFSDNIVAIGANGSGKTSLANHLKGYLQNNGIVVSAQRVLNIPHFNSIQNPTKTMTALKQCQQNDKTCKSENSYSRLNNEFNIVLQNLLAENITNNNKYAKQAQLLAEEGKSIPNPSDSKLDKTFSIWTDLIEHRVIETDDGINIVVRTKDNSDYYPAIQMSDGEKVILYLIAQILQAPNDGFIIVDEPEMHLHKTILKKLWDRLETEREDCIFIYLTHDLDFATSRNTAKKIWLKSYTIPQNWEIQDIPTNELPESLMLELLGSRKSILFCEGEKGTIDDCIYHHLFANHTIMPVGNCQSVINYTRAYNKLPNTYSKAFGIIDADFHETTEIESLKKDSIYTCRVAEIENLFLNTDFLLLLAKQLMKEDIDIDNIKKEILSKFEADKELQISNYLSTKINYLYSTSHVKKGNSKDKVIENFNSFNSDIKIEEWYSNREIKIDKIIAEGEYSSAIILYNNKGIKKIVSQHFKIADFQESSLKLLIKNPDAKNILLQYFPDELKK